MISKIIFLIPLVILLFFYALSWIPLINDLLKKSFKEVILVILAGLLSPFGMFYFGFTIGIVSIIGVILAVIPWTYFQIPINIWFHILRILVFIWMGMKISSLPSNERKNLNRFNFQQMVSLIWEICQGFFVYGIIVYLLWNILK